MYRIQIDWEKVNLLEPATDCKMENLLIVPFVSAEKLQGIRSAFPQANIVQLFGTVTIQDWRDSWMPTKKWTYKIEVGRHNCSQTAAEGEFLPPDDALRERVAKTAAIYLNGLTGSKDIVDWFDPNSSVGKVDQLRSEISDGSEIARY